MVKVDKVGRGVNFDQKLVDVSNIVYEVIMKISSLFFFFYKKILKVKEAPKRKQTIFTLLEFFVRAKNCLLVFVLLVDFWL